MKLLEKHLDKYNNSELEIMIYDQYNLFNYTSRELFKLHLDFLLENMYNIKLVAPKRKRLNQLEFREEVKNKFNNKCIITNETCLDELEAAHIVPVAENENYDIDNGLLMVSNIHKTFDKLKWSINPDTMRIVIRNNTNVGQIKEYNNKYINISSNEKFKRNLKWHYEKFSNV